MRMISVIAATLLAASAASAQVYGSGCRGTSISALAGCVAARTPPPVASPAPEEYLEEVEPLTTRTVRRSTLGGAIQRSDLRTPPPVVNRAAAPTLAPSAASGGIVSFEPLNGLTDDPNSVLNGTARRDSARGQILRYDPLVGIENRVQDR